MSFDQALEQGMLSDPDCIAAAYVDMTTGLLLGSKHMANYGPELLDVVAAATADLFQGQNVSNIEDLWRRYRPWLQVRPGPGLAAEVLALLPRRSEALLPLIEGLSPAEAAETLAVVVSQVRDEIEEVMRSEPTPPDLGTESSNGPQHLLDVQHILERPLPGGRNVADNDSA